jgi:signal transduction histidine kinase
VIETAGLGQTLAAPVFRPICRREPMFFSSTSNPNKLKLNIAIVGGGQACRFFLKLLQKESLPYLDVRIVGVCDIDPEAEGFKLARSMGIFTTTDYRDLFAIDDLDSILELTNSRQLLRELIDHRPVGVGIIEHNIGRFLRFFFLTDQRMKSLERQLVLERMSSDILIQHSNAAILVLDTDFTVVEANEAFLKEVQKTKEEVVGAPCFQISYGLTTPCPNSRQDLQCPMIETLRTGKSAHVIHEIPGSGFEASYQNIVTYPLIDSYGKIIRIIEIKRDISEEIESRWDQRNKRLKQEFNHLIQEDRMISLGKLVAGCVHEINNPIQGMLTFTSLMQSMLAGGKLSAGDLEEFKQYLEMMSEELERCGRIVSGLLSFSREKPLQYKVIDLNDLIQSVVTLAHNKMQMQRIEMTTTLSKLPMMISGDRNRLQQCMLNLLFNAMEAMPGGGTLSIISKSDKKKFMVEVKDTGEGIAEEHMDQIFNPFFTTKAEGQGTGLGLSIVYNVVKMHRGEISVESRLGQGSRFILSFPHEDAPDDQKAGTI